nr:ATP-binding cassette domain-containing protein [Candidatus Sigynarchaeota archaeon]
VFGYVLYLLLFFQPLGTIANMFASIQNASVGGARVLRLLGTEPDLKESPDAKETDVLQGNILFDNACFSYIDGEQVLDNLTLDIKRGERIAIVGPTGAGKTTLISLIPRFYDVNSGRILIDGVDVREYKFRTLRRNIGMVLQDNFLFAGSILENIRYGKLGASDEEVFEASKKAGAHPFINMLPDGYETLVGERGAVLSIGQRQLIAFARALLADPPILILDEATSSVDAYSEILIQQSLENLLKHRTSIIIAHRLSTIVNSDTIIVLVDGKVKQKGDHVSLMQDTGGLYHKLYSMQFAESTKEMKIKQ